MSIAPATIPKITAILPRLASEHDGEIVASVRAIGRVLHSGGNDWHDFTATFERGVNAPDVRSKNRSATAAPTWRAAAYYERDGLLAMLCDQDWLSPWERSFVASITTQYTARRSLSPKQIDIIDRLLDRAFAEGEHV
jgi:hypothetical protein